MSEGVSSEQRSSEPRLIMMGGLPGSGKTTRARALEAELGAVRFSTDEWKSERDTLRPRARELGAAV